MGSTLLGVDSCASSSAHVSGHYKCNIYQECLPCWQSISLSPATYNVQSPVFDYCNSLYFNLPKTQINRLQHIQISLARTVANTPKYSHITPVLESFHWLKIEQRIQYKLISLTKFSPSVNLLIYIISSLFKLTIILVPLMLSHLLVHLPPLPLRSQIALFSIPRLISGINFHFHFVNQFHLFILTSIHPSLLHFPHDPVTRVGLTGAGPQQKSSGPRQK